MIRYQTASVNYLIPTPLGDNTMKIAIIGSGISGLSCAYYLHRQHDVHVFESAQRIGGHTATVDVAMGGRRFAVDTGFIVYNDWTYPNFIALMDELGVSRKATRMSFSVSDSNTGLEYAGSSLNTLFAQRRNLLSPRFWKMIWGILRFNKKAQRDLDSGAASADLSLGDYLVREGYSDGFINQYLLPMGSAIWSADTPVMFNFPLQFFIRFFRNHGLLQILNRPQWRVIEGGSREYLAPLCQGFANNIHTNSDIGGVWRHADHVELEINGQRKHFDHVVFACHSDQALALLRDPDPAETEILGQLPYQDNEVILHTDVSLLPHNRSCWSAWNYQLGLDSERATVTYNMNLLQGLEAPETFCVTLNNTAAINPYLILGRFNYAHPVFTLEGMQAQERWGEINHDRTWFCGAYWRNGFHEDGVFSGKRVAAALSHANSQQQSPSQAMVSAA